MFEKLAYFTQHFEVPSQLFLVNSMILFLFLAEWNFLLKHWSSWRSSLGERKEWPRRGCQLLTEDFWGSSHSWQKKDSLESKRSSSSFPPRREKTNTFHSEAVGSRSKMWWKLVHWAPIPKAELCSPHGDYLGFLAKEPMSRGAGEQVWQGWTFHSHVPIKDVGKGESPRAGTVRRAE